MNYSSFSYTVADIVGSLPILRLIGTRGGFTCYTVGQGGQSFNTLRAARAYAKRLTSR